MKPEQINELKEAFALFDKNGDGKITSEELKNILNALGLYTHFKKIILQGCKLPNELDVENVVNQNENNGFIDFESFKKIMAEALKEDVTFTPEDLIQAFLPFDKTNNGHVSLDEIKKVLVSSSKLLTEAEVCTKI